MWKKFVCAAVFLLFTASFCPVALAEGDNTAAGASYTVQAAKKTVLSGKKASFTVTTPVNVYKVKLYLDGRYKKNATYVKKEGNKKIWKVSQTLNIIGKRYFQFRAYSKKGTYLRRFPKPSMKITVKQSPPVTNDAVVLDSDRAVLLGTPPVYSGYRQTSHGFYLGLSADKLTKKLASKTIVRNRINRMATGLKPETVYYYRAYTVTRKGVFKGKICSFKTPAKRQWLAEDAVFEKTSERYKYLFGSTRKFYKITSPPFGYNGYTEASKHMVKISVPVWKLVDGEKTSGKMSLTVNYKLKENVRAIFDEIHALDIKFPVKTLAAFQYRRIGGPGLEGSKIQSHHSFGAAIDINKKYNGFYLRRDKRDKNSPYYIPDSVVEIFEKYGWAWGGDFKEGFDTMHFQYLGLDLTGK